MHTGVFNQSGAEISAYDRLTHRIYFTDAGQNRLHMADISNPAAPVDLGYFDLTPYGAGPNSVSVGVFNDSSYLAVACDAVNRQNPGTVVFLDNNLGYINSVTVGAVPDMLTFTHDNLKVLVCNEAEPSSDYALDPDGSVSIIDVSSGPASAVVHTATFTSYNGQENALRAQGIRIYGNNGNATAAQDFEPEYLAISEDGQTAYVTLQENNAIAIVNIASATVTSLVPLGYKNWNVPGNTFDASDQDGPAIHLQNWPVFGMYEPDGIAGLYVGGQQYFITANEGDSREYNGVNNELVRVGSGSYVLDPTVFPNRTTLKQNANLGRLRVTNKLGDIDHDGDFDAIYSLGGRSFSILNATGQIIYDSGNDFETRLAALMPGEFNSTNDANQSFDTRSDDKGPEPEGVTVGSLGGRSYAFINIERIGGVMVYDVTNPAAPVYETYISSRNFGYSFPGSPSLADLQAVVELGPEQTVFVSAADSPNGQALLLAGNEVSGSVSIYQMDCSACDGPLSLTILHNNDGESKLINAGDGQLANFGGVARFKTVEDSLKVLAMSRTDGYVLLSSGDNFLAGKEFNCGQTSGMWYDAMALDRIGYTALCFGNHDFDFGPDVLADLIGHYSQTTPPYLCANGDFSGEPAMQALVNAGRIRSWTTTTVNGQTIGIIGAITPLLSYISSPRHVIIDPNVTASVQSRVDSLTAMGINKIILIAHLQSIREDSALIRTLHGVDVAIAGGGSEVLANAGDLLVPGHVVYGPYPLQYPDADGNLIPVITTEGDYTYVGQLVVNFDSAGHVSSVDPFGDSGPVRVSAVSPDAVTPNADMQNSVVAPLSQCVSTLNAHIIGTSSANLDGRRNLVRTRETNEGDLCADALLWQGIQLAPAFGLAAPNVGMQNGGGIRNNSIIPAGNISEGTTFDMLPFANFVSIAPNIPAAQFKNILENCVSRVEAVDGRFAQVAGVHFTWDPAGTPMVIDLNGNVTTPGSRIKDVVLNDGTVLVSNGIVAAIAPAVNIVTNDFSARGGDLWPFNGAAFTTLGITYQQALANYITAPRSIWGLGGNVDIASYGLCGTDRITRLYNSTATNPSGDNSATAWNPNFVNDFHTADVAAMAISFPAQTAGHGNPGSVNARYSTERPANATEYDLPSAYTIGRFYNITASSENFTGATLTLRFTSCELPSGITDPAAANLQAVYSNDNGATWTRAQGTLAGPVNGAYSYTISNVSHLSLWALGAGDRILAVELASISATAGDGEVTLIWTTSSETDNDHFVIERDGRRLATVASAGNTASGHDYQYTDRNLVNGTMVTYTLYAVDLSGQHIRLSSINATPRASAATITEYALYQNYPNPFNPTTSIALDMVDAGDVSLKVYNTMGQQVVSLVNGTMSAGHHTVTFDVSNLTSGVYLYRLNVNGFRAEKKMVLMK